MFCISSCIFHSCYRVLFFFSHFIFFFCCAMELHQYGYNVIPHVSFIYSAISYIYSTISQHTIISTTLPLKTITLTQMFPPCTRVWFTGNSTERPFPSPLSQTWSLPLLSLLLDAGRCPNPFTYRPHHTHSFLLDVLTPLPLLPVLWCPSYSSSSPFVPYLTALTSLPCSVLPALLIDCIFLFLFISLPKKLLLIYRQV